MPTDYVRPETRPAGRWFATSMWAVFNLMAGAVAIVPSAIGLGLLAYVVSGPYSPGTNHTYAKIGGHSPPLLEIDTDEAGIVGFFLVFALVFVGVLFLVVNAPLRRHVVPAVAAWFWRTAFAILLAPSIVFLIAWWLTPERP